MHRRSSHLHLVNRSFTIDSAALMRGKRKGFSYVRVHVPI